MKYAKLIFWLVIASALLYLGSHSFVLGGNRVPPMLKLFSPQSGFWQNARIASDQTGNHINLPDLNAQVDVFFNDRQIPHVYASSRKDLYRVQGYLHGFNRLWQLDITSRATAGRLSAVMGPDLKAVDKRARRKGMLQAARRLEKIWRSDKDLIADLEAYVDGVNHFSNNLSYSEYPIEYKLLDYAPTPYSLQDMILIAISMTNALCGYSSDLALSDMATRLSAPEIEQFFPMYHENDIPVIPDAEIEELNNSMSNELGEIIRQKGHNPYPDRTGIGSNNWVIDSTKSATGGGILADDPHLPLTLPSIWYESHLQTPAMNVYGVSLPGAPGIIIGFNDSIAWGVTNMAHDVIDYYRIEWTDASKRAYTLDDKSHALEYLVEEIEVRGGLNVTDSIPLTYWGPMPHYDEDNNRKDLAMRWILHKHMDHNIFETFIKMNKAHNYDDFKDALQYFEAPGQNFVFLSHNENIALRPQAKYIKRKQGRGQYIYPGNTLDSDWDGALRFSEQPYAYNPDQHYLASANQITNSPKFNYPYYGKFEDYRGRSINYLLSNNNSIDFDDFKNFQNDNTSFLAQDLKDDLISYINPQSLSENGRKWYDLLKEWNHSYDADKIAPVLWEKWFAQLKRDLWDEPIWDRSRPHDVAAVALLKQDTSIYFDHVSTPAIEDKSDIIKSSFVSVLDTLKNPVSWGRYKGTLIRHLARIPAFSRPIETPGFKSALNAQTKTNGPSWRMIVSLNPEVTAYGVYPGGQSGRPGSVHYDDMVEQWSDGEYYILESTHSQNDCKKSGYYLTQFER